MILAHSHLYEFPPTDLLGLFMWVAIACVVAWGIVAFVKWLQWPIPEPVRIVAIVLFCIFMILLMFRVFNSLIP